MELYVHIPYCAQKCRYCDFASYAGQAHTMERYVHAVLTEAEAMSQALAEPVETVFLGGGTPSLLPPDLLQQLLEGLHRLYPILKDAEFTTEANPGTLTKEWLDVAVRCGVNRLSMGMQASQTSLLRTLGRIHDFSQVEESVRLARACGVKNVNLDLMFGLPGQTVDMWQDTLSAALSLQPEHLSCYGLIPEEGTPLVRDLDAGRLSLPDEDEERRMYDLTLSVLADNGFLQYEISNFARPGYTCRHNIGYWRQIPYIGLGASAASLLPDCAGWRRTTNPAALQAYIDMAESKRWELREATQITPVDARFETLMLGLRMTEGVSEDAFQKMHGISLASICGSLLQDLAARGFLEHCGSWWRLTRKGMDIQNTILVELLEHMERGCPE